MDKIKKLVREVLSTPPKKKCGCSVKENDTLGNKDDVKFATNVLMPPPYVELLKAIEKDWGKGDLYYEVEQAIFDGNLNQVQNILKNYEVDKEYIHLLRLNEDYASKLYKIEGLLITDTKKKTQSQTFSDIRSITGITTMDAKEYEPRLPKKGYMYDKITLKIDPYPYVKNNTVFDINTLNKIISNINRIKGVVKFVVKDPKLLNIGI